MTFAYQTDEFFTRNAPATYYGAQKYLLADRKFGTQRRVSIPLETGLEEAPRVVVTTTSTPSEALIGQLEQVIGEFRALKSLENGWDSYEGRRVRREAIAPALQLVLEAVLKCRIPRIQANSEGGIDLIWEQEDRQLSLSVDQSGRFEALYESPEGAFEEPDGLIDLAQAKAYLDLLATQQQ